jgi:hypothetical protein
VVFDLLGWVVNSMNAAISGFCPGIGSVAPADLALPRLLPPDTATMSAYYLDGPIRGPPRWPWV